jgi:hypothetical protein
MLNCIGIEGRIAKEKSPAKAQGKLPSSDCCTGYNIEWNGKAEDDVFCIKAENNKNCAIENKMIKATIYRYCTNAAIKQLAYLAKDLNNLSQLSRNFLIKKIFHMA